MLVVLIQGELGNKLRRNCYNFLIEKYRKEKLCVDWNLLTSEYRRTSEEGVQSPGSDKGMQEESQQCRDN
ncbi:hypothetical protein MK805_01995 [Shimazuella sp. AN120528]|nr:hypothetical protein [Shimazuella soli]